jgi:DNA-binding MarR family transcriptional regulator
LQIAGAPGGTVTTVGYLAERLVLRHHSVVELSTRCEEAGLIVRRQDARDARRVVLQLTPSGDRLLRQLSEDHARELHELGPQLIRSLKASIADGGAHSVHSARS